MDTVAHPPATLEGWYALHQVLTIDRPSLREVQKPERFRRLAGFESALRELAIPADGGWSAAVELMGSTADVMIVHFRPTLDGIAEAQRRLAREPLSDSLRTAYSFLSVTELGLYHLTAQLARDAETRGGKVGDEEYQLRLAERAQAELQSEHARRRLHPARPAELPYVCFYPMSKRRTPGQNWYALALQERSRLMHAHGQVGRRYAGRVQQVITGAIGLDAWEWGVTLFAADPLLFKQLVTEMRFDEASAQYAEFGPFYVGRAREPRDWMRLVADVLGVTNGDG